MSETAKNDEQHADRVHDASKVKYNASRSRSRRSRKLLRPAKPGTIKQSVIRKAIKEVMDAQSHPS
jgi:hypothetical protein